MTVLDQATFNFINGFAGRWRWLDFLGIFFARYFEYVLLVGLFLLLLRDYKKYWRMILEAFLAAFVVRLVMVEIIRRIFFRPRPFVFNQVHLLVPYSMQEPSFPSSHASFYFALSTIIFGYHKKAGILCYLGSFFIVLSRIFVGIHWPSDVVAGMALGIVMGLVLNIIFKKLSSNG